MEMPPLKNDDEDLDLRWHALNYRTADTRHAEAMWQELERYVENYGELCARMAREQERESLAQSVEKLVDGWDGPYRRSADLIVLAIRKG